jgi:hypothetical protein
MEKEETVRGCEHMTFTAKVDVTRLFDTLPMQFRADIKIQCAECKEDFEFGGIPIGYDPHIPTTSADKFTLRIPIKPNTYTREVRPSARERNRHGLAS